MTAPLVVNTRDGMCWTRRQVTRDGLALYALADVCKCPPFVMATLSELAEHGITSMTDVLPVPVGEPVQASETAAELRETLEKQTALLREVQALCRKRGKEIAGRKLHGDLLKLENTRLLTSLHEARKTIRSVRTLLTERTPFAPNDRQSIELALSWMADSRDEYHKQVYEAEVFARRTQARISALLLEPTDPQACALCSVSEDGHGVRVTEGFEHEWTRPTDALVRERELMQRALERTASGEPAVSELAWLRARNAYLEAERHTTNEALSEAAEALRATGGAR